MSPVACKSLKGVVNPLQQYGDHVHEGLVIFAGDLIKHGGLHTCVTLGD